jgi:hypothetical protein
LTTKPSPSRPSHHVFAALAEDLTWFIKCPEIRVLHIATGATERPVVVHQLALTEGHGHNRSPFFVLEDARTSSDDGWLARAERVAVIHEARRKAMAGEGHELPALAPLVHGGDALSAMGWQLQQCLAAQQSVPILEGLVVVLAPTALAGPMAFAEEILSLLRAPSLRGVRFVVVEVGRESVGTLADVLREQAMFVECAVDPADYRREQAEILAACAAAPPGASPEVSTGGAGPKGVVAPPRHGKPPRDAALSPAATELLTEELGPAASLIGAVGALLRQRILGAALAMQEGEAGRAVALQAEACTQCLDAGLVRFGCILELILGGYLLHAGDPARAQLAFETAAARAEAHALPDVAAQAHLGLGAVLVVRGNLDAAAQRYAHAGELAMGVGERLLAIEAYRTAGQVALRAGAEAAAVTAWRRALVAASEAPPEALALSSAPVVARALAKVMQDRASFEAAQSLLDQADEYERAPRAQEPRSRGAAMAPSMPLPP